MKKRIINIICVLAVIILAAGSAYYFLRDDSTENGTQTIIPMPQQTDPQQEQIAQLRTQIEQIKTELAGDELRLINGENKLDKDFTPTMTEIPKNLMKSGVENGTFDSRHIDKLISMLSDLNASEQGGGIVVVSAYRPYSLQEYYFNNSVKSYTDSGWSEQAAREKVAKSVAVPGTSEHQYGMTADIADGTDLNNEVIFAKPFAGWLASNAHKYGFILRYPEDKTEITKIMFEPWHFRYVGEPHAAAIYESGMCLEEYIDELNKQITDLETQIENLK